MLNIRDNIAELRGILIRLIDDKLKQPHPAVAAADRERAERLLDEIQMAWECGRVEHHHHYEPAPMLPYPVGPTPQWQSPIICSTSTVAAK